MIKKRILLIGSNGMLGQRVVSFYANKENYELLTASAESESYFDVNYRQVDIADKSNVKELITNFYPDIVINTAAYTNVDGCETNKETAWNINVKGVEYLIKYCAAVHARLIHVSSDYVFDGENGPYTEVDKVNPISYYGRSKLAAENLLSSSSIDYTIIRTNVLYGPTKFGRPDFVKWVVSSLQEGKHINIVDDQYNNPTFISDLAWAIFKFGEDKKMGLYNIAGKEVLNRYEFTLKIAEYFKLDKSLINRIKTVDLNQPAKRPLKSGLINLKAETEIAYKPSSIEETLAIMRAEFTNLYS